MAPKRELGLGTLVTCVEYALDRVEEVAAALKSGSQDRFLVGSIFWLHDRGRRLGHGGRRSASGLLIQPFRLSSEWLPAVRPVQ